MEVSYAKGHTYTIPTIKYLDFVAGVSACTLGHQPFRVNQAIKEQLDKYSHVMVYGEYSQSPAVEYCKLMADLLPEPLINLLGQFWNRSHRRRSKTSTPRYRS
jgi:adenosylmethionine-8-amino-7-oxononanoate aminotransferase